MCLLVILIYGGFIKITRFTLSSKKEKKNTLDYSFYFTTDQTMAKNITTPPAGVYSKTKRERYQFNNVHTCGLGAMQYIYKERNHYPCNRNQTLCLNKLGPTHSSLLTWMSIGAP